MRLSLVVLFVALLSSTSLGLPSDGLIESVVKFCADNGLKNVNVVLDNLNGWNRQGIASFVIISKIALAGGELVIFWFSLTFSHKQRQKPLATVPPTSFINWVARFKIGVLQATPNKIGAFLPAAIGQRPRNYLSCCPCSPFGSFPHSKEFK